MKSDPDPHLVERYQQVLCEYPIQQTSCLKDQTWKWIDTRNGEQTLLLLPGLMGEAETSFLFIQALAASMRVVSVSHPPSVGQVQVFCDGLSALLDHLDIQEAVILGGSSGGLLAQAFLRRFPQRVAGLILTHTGLSNPQRAKTMRFFMAVLELLPFGLVRWLMQLSTYSFFPLSTPGQVFWRDHFRAILQQMSQTAFRNRFRLMEDFHANCQFHTTDEIGDPGRILLMEMPRDHLSSSSEQAAMRGLYPGANLHTFTHAGHFDAVEEPFEQIQVIQNFVLSRPSHE
jgi:pimeloyl-ACP methyl ester carboxylesterase